MESSKGTSRQPRIRRPSLLTIFSMATAASAAFSGSDGRKAMPVA